MTDINLDEIRASIKGCQTCDGRGEVGGFDHAEQGYRNEPCPECAYVLALLAEIERLRDDKWYIRFQIARAAEIKWKQRAEAAEKVVEAASDFVLGMSATGWTPTDGLVIGPPDDERPAVLVERDLFIELQKIVDGYKETSQ